ncbi:hypothetical protein [Actinomadura rubrisoli]|uniref:Tc toxin complex TcA C-terminal TcB-binding domain-containing protein n=1 Tax=Actinomadura rubrisoli TaxID=2530368 RepID=A0A4R5C405_9ACTN|nr:hypothetical protein [Actinomadura rubrisoli]TDD94338.1 hypothetical protein E1298_06995 [Actinomadura rubrisoli]
MLYTADAEVREDEARGPSANSRDSGWMLAYRDYLRKTWTNMVGRVVVITTRITEEQALQQLTNRFHQDFTVSGTDSRPANEILIPILREILTAPTGGTFGFGVPPEQIPARGDATARTYLDTLIGLTKISAAELSLRYRTDFARADGEMSSAVGENIRTLQAFFRDGFQSPPDPVHTVPDVLRQPIVPEAMQGRAPFFLGPDEWLARRRPVPLENYFQIRNVFHISVTPAQREEIKKRAVGQGTRPALFRLYARALEVMEKIEKAYRYLDLREHRAAYDLARSARDDTFGLLQNEHVKQIDVVEEFRKRKQTEATSLDDLAKITELWKVTGPYPDTGEWDSWADFYRTRIVCGLAYADVFTLPALCGQAALGLGDYSTAARLGAQVAGFAIGKGAADAKYAWRAYYIGSEEGESNAWRYFSLYHDGPLPYTVDTAAEPGLPPPGDDDSYYWGAGRDDWPSEKFNRELIPECMHPVEMRYFRLQLGVAMLDWADTLYRTDEPGNIGRARELYKGVYYLHGEVPPTEPAWSAPPVPPVPERPNPAHTSQLSRAQLGFSQISAGLNCFGFAPDMVPLLRYSTLKAAADTLAASAQSVQEDFLNAMAQLEGSLIENMKDSAMLQRATLQSRIAQQQAGVAADQIVMAKTVVGQVQQQIESVKSEIADHDSFFGQLGDYFDGMQKIVTGLPGWATGPVGTSAAVEAGFSTEVSTGLLGMGTAATTVTGMGAFFVASYITLSSMTDAANGRRAHLAALQAKTLPVAEAQLDIAQRSAAIAGLQQRIADVDARLAGDLLEFAQVRFLNVEFWSSMAALLQRILRRYLDLATRTAWLAERALAYEQNTTVDLVRTDYFPAARGGAGGADQLRLDLANLQTRYLENIRELVPVKHTISLARDLPLQFAQLRATGRCRFQTLESAVRAAYPGTYGHRVIAVTPRVIQAAGTAPVRGLLSSTGISQIGAPDGTMEPSARPADALPISEFDLGTTDREIYGLPGSALMQFEGGGFQSQWTLEFPAAANLSGLRDVVDVLITFDLRAQYAAPLHHRQAAAAPTTVDRFVLVSAFQTGLEGLKDLREGRLHATLAFDLAKLGLPRAEKARTINNLAVLICGAEGEAPIKAKVTAALPRPLSVPVSMPKGIAFSNRPPITDPQSTAPPSPLNALGGIPADQAISVTIDHIDNTDVDFENVRDVLLGIDYKAQIS